MLLHVQKEVTHKAKWTLKIAKMIHKSKRANELVKYLTSLVIKEMCIKMPVLLLRLAKAFEVIALSTKLLSVR